MTGIFINSENLSRFEIKKQIRSLTNGYNGDLLIDLYNEFNFFSVGELMKINSYTKKINELEFKLNYIKEEGFIVDFFPKTKYKIVSGIIRKDGYEEFRLNNLNFEDYQDFLNLTFDFTCCFNEIVKSINQTDADFDRIAKDNDIKKHSEIVPYSKHESVFSNNGFVLFEHILNEYVKNERGRLSDIHYFYWAMYNDTDKFIHQRPEPFKEWFFKTYNEDLGKIKTFKEVQNPDREKHYSNALNWFNLLK